ncbi:MAG: type I methionyl aminopeptidase [Acidobacteriota bacterium]
MAEIEIMDRCNGIVVDILKRLAERVQPGVSTAELDRFAEEATREAGAVPAFKGYRGFPASLCTSVNNEVVHGIPSPKRAVQEGDILSLDFGVILEGYYGDSALTVPVGTISPKAQRLLDVTRESLNRGIARMQSGNHLSDVSNAIQTHVESEGYSVVREFVGHGIGHQLHEDPQVPNFGSPGHGPILREGLVLAIEPMVTEGNPDVLIGDDDWTVRSVDGGWSAHFERSVAVTENGPLLLGGKPI